MTDRKEAKEAGIVWNDFIFKVSQDDLYVFLEDPLIEASVKQKFNDHWKEIKTFYKKKVFQPYLKNLKL